jgi:ABC-2 type transport system ATP-binding protein
VADDEAGWRGKEDRVIEVRYVAKRYGDTVAVDGLSFTVRTGQVTGFLGPNGSGKSTTMRLIIGLDAPNAGEINVNGRPHCDLEWPLREVGALLGAKATHAGSRWRHVRCLWLAQGKSSNAPMCAGRTTVN